MIPPGRMAILNLSVCNQPFPSWTQPWCRATGTSQNHTITLATVPAPVEIVSCTRASINGLHCACSYQGHSPAFPPTHLASWPPCATPGCLWAVGCLPLRRPGSGQTFLYLTQYHRLPPRSCSRWGGGWNALPWWPALRSDHWPLWKLPQHCFLRRNRGSQQVHLLVIHSWLPKGPGSGNPKDAGGSAPCDSGSNWRLRSARGFTSIIGLQLKLHTATSLLCKGPVFRNTACSLPLTGQLLLVTWTT